LTAKANSFTSTRTLTFIVTATAGARRATATRTVVEAPKPPPLEITSEEELPVGTTGTPYSANLTATGGTGAYHWTVTGGALPAGLTLSPAGTISGTPTGADGGTANVQVQDDAGVVAQDTVTIAVAGSALPSLAAPQPGMSNNWSGYIVTGGPFTAAAGTFNVPNVTAGTSDTDTSQWVGIDGVDNSNLIQAGVDESVQGGSVTDFAWWEILPAPATVIPTLVINPNDHVTVAIVRQADGNWLIQIQDTTDHESWHTAVAYSGPLSSAEWILEAPTNADTNNLEPLGPYSPPVTFTNLALAGPASTLLEAVMYDPTYTTAISTPSPLSTSGFTVAYGSTQPPGP
jgi:hypothetical protein